MLKVVFAKFFIPMLILANNPVVVPEPVEVSRGETHRIEKRVMRVTAYTASDTGMNGKGITTSGEKVQEGRTIAAPPDIPLYSQIYIPVLGQTYTVTDRGGAIKGNRLDLFMESRAEALEFGVQELEVLIKK
jgi:3D (Asp-Asp-Asp) domain-containing protein